MTDTGILKFQVQRQLYAIVWDWNVSKNLMWEGLVAAWCYWELVETIKGGSNGMFQVTNHALKGEYVTLVSSSPFSYVLALRRMALFHPRLLS